MKMQHYNLCLLGFGNVGRNLAQLLLDKTHDLRERYAITWDITGIATRRMGWLVNSDGFDVPALLAGDVTSSADAGNVYEWLAAAQADVLFEITSLNPETGQPAIDHMRAALAHGAHAITANKGTIVHAYHELREQAASTGLSFLFEATVADGLPVFSIFRDTLPVARLRRFRGLLNSTTSIILSEIEAGRTFDEAIQAAQKLGITETDPSADIDGWDAAVKVVALATVLMDRPIKLDDVQREGIRGLTREQIQTARQAGTPYKLVSYVDVVDGQLSAVVRPQQVPLTDPLGSAGPEALVLHFQLDTIPDLTLIEDHAGPYSTAYGLLSDFIVAARR